MEDAYSKAEGFFRRMRKKDKALILYHRDGDGMASAVLAGLIAKDICGKIPKMIPKTGKVTFTMREIEELNAKMPDKIIIVDLNADRSKEELLSLEADIILIDHHKPANNLNPAIPHINPRLENPAAYVPASCVVWRIGRYMGIDLPSKIAFIGTLSDYGLSECPDLREAFNKENPELSVGDAKEKEIFDNFKIGEFAKAVGSARTVAKDAGCRKAVKAMLEDDYSEARKYMEIVDSELERLEKKFTQEKEEFGDIDFFIFSSRYDLGSPMSTVLFAKRPERTLIILQRKREKIKVHGRSNNVDIAELLVKAAEGIGEGGGHPKAAGAMIPAKMLGDFKERIISMS